MEVINRAIGDFSPPPPTQTRVIGQSLRRLSKSFSAHGEHDQQNLNRMGNYVNLKLQVEDQLNKMSAAGPAPLSVKEGGSESSSDDGKGPPKNRHLVNRQPSARLNWQPSYVASKKNAFADNDDDDDDDDDSDSTHNKKKKNKKSQFCVIS